MSTILREQPSPEAKSKRRAELMALARAAQIDEEYFTSFEHSFIETILEENQDWQRLFFSEKQEKVLSDLFEKVRKR